MKTTMFKCDQCGKPMNPVDKLINPVCKQCAVKNHKSVIKK